VLEQEGFERRGIVGQLGQGSLSMPRGARRGRHGRMNQSRRLGRRTQCRVGVLLGGNCRGRRRVRTWRDILVHIRKDTTKVPSCKVLMYINILFYFNDQIMILLR
jgi:hypothetical protein